MDLIPFIMERIAAAIVAAHNGNFTLIILLQLIITIPSVGLCLCVFIGKNGPKNKEANAEKQRK